MREKKTRWKVFYGDGTTAEGVGRQKLDEPRGVQVIVQDHPEVGVESVTGCDYYVWREGRWWGVDIFGLFDYLMESGLVLFGRTIEREEYQAIARKALAEKETWLPRERRP